MVPVELDTIIVWALYSVAREGLCLHIPAMKGGNTTFVAIWFYF